MSHPYAPPIATPCSVTAAGTSRALQRPFSLVCYTSVLLAINRFQNKANRNNCNDDNDGNDSSDDERH